MVFEQDCLVAYHGEDEAEDREQRGQIIEKPPPIENMEVHPVLSDILLRVLHVLIGDCDSRLI